MNKPTATFQLTAVHINELLKAGRCTDWENDDFASAINTLTQAKADLEKPETLQNLYLSGGEGHCPKCQSSSIEGDAVEINGSLAHQEVACTDCEATWVDEYTLTGISDASGFEPNAPAPSYIDLDSLPSH